MADGQTEVPVWVATLLGRLLLENESFRQTLSTAAPAMNPQALELDASETEQSDG